MKDSNDNLRKEIMWAVAMLEDAVKKEADAARITMDRRRELARMVDQAHAKPVSVPDDHPHQAETVLAAALALSDTALRESRMGPKLKEAIWAYRKAMTPKGTE